MGHYIHLLVVWLRQNRCLKIDFFNHLSSNNIYGLKTIFPPGHQ